MCLFIEFLPPLKKCHFVFTVYCIHHANVQETYNIVFALEKCQTKLQMLCMPTNSEICHAL